MKFYEKFEYSYFVIVFITFCVFISFKLFIIGPNDDLSLQWLLKANEAGTLIMSYPLSIFLGKLYTLFPNINILSILYIFVYGIDLLLLTVFIRLKYNVFERTILYALTVICFLYIATNLSITILTVLTMVIAACFINISFIVFSILFFFASFLRIDIYIVVLPFFIVSFLLIRDRKLSKRDIKIFILGILIILFNLFYEKQDLQYSEWKKFNSARGTISDLKFNSIGISNKEKLFIKKWFLQDELLLSTERVINANVSLQEIILQKLNLMKIYNAIKRSKAKKLFIILSLFTILLMFLPKITIKSRILLITFLIGILLLVLIRNVDRVIVPLFLLWIIVLSTCFKHYAYNKLNNIVLLLFVYFFFTIYQKSISFTTNNDLKIEGIELLTKSKILCEPSVRFPFNWGKARHLYNNNRLLDEENWIGIKDGLLPSGWLARHRYFNETHNLSDKYRKRKFESYYSFLIDKNTGFIADRGSQETSFTKTVLLEYDKLYLKNTKCKHIVISAINSKNYEIFQIRKQCDNTF